MDHDGIVLHEEEDELEEEDEEVGGDESEEAETDEEEQEMDFEDYLEVLVSRNCFLLLSVNYTYGLRSNSFVVNVGGMVVLQGADILCKVLRKSTSIKTIKINLTTHRHRSISVSDHAQFLQQMEMIGRALKDMRSLQRLHFGGFKGDTAAGVKAVLHQLYHRKNLLRVSLSDCPLCPQLGLHRLFGVQTLNFINVDFPLAAVQEMSRFLTYPYCDAVPLLRTIRITWKNTKARFW